MWYRNTWGALAAAAFMAVSILAQLAGPRHAVAVDQNLTDPADDVWYVDEQNSPVQGPIAGHSADIRSVQVRIEADFVEVRVDRANDGAGDSSAILARLGVIEALLQYHQGQVTTYVARNGNPVPGASITSPEMTLRSTTLRVPLAEIDRDQLQQLGIYSFHREPASPDNPNQMRGYDVAGPYSIDLAPPPAPTDTPVPTDTPTPTNTPVTPDDESESPVPTDATDTPVPTDTPVTPEEPDDDEEDPGAAAGEADESLEPTNTPVTPEDGESDDDGDDPVAPPGAGDDDAAGGPAGDGTDGDQAVASTDATIGHSGGEGDLLLILFPIVAGFAVIVIGFVVWRQRQPAPALGNVPILGSLFGGRDRAAAEPVLVLEPSDVTLENGGDTGGPQPGEPVLGGVPVAGAAFRQGDGDQEPSEQGTQLDYNIPLGTPFGPIMLETPQSMVDAVEELTIPGGPPPTEPVGPVLSPLDSPVSSAESPFEAPYVAPFPIHWPAGDRERSPHEILSEEFEHLDRVADGWYHVAVDEHQRKYDETIEEIEQNRVNEASWTPGVLEQYNPGISELLGIDKAREQQAREQLEKNLADLERLRDDPEYREQRRREIAEELEKYPPADEPVAETPGPSQPEPVPVVSTPAPTAPAPERVSVNSPFPVAAEPEAFPFILHAPVPNGEVWDDDQSLRAELEFIERLGDEPFLDQRLPARYGDAVRTHHEWAKREKEQIIAESQTALREAKAGGEEYDPTSHQAEMEAIDAELASRLADLERLRRDGDARSQRMLEIHDEQMALGPSEPPPPVTEPVVTIRTVVRGEPLTSVAAADEFFVVVDIPPGEGSPPPTITVKMDASSNGEQEDVVLEYVGPVDGGWRYASHDRIKAGDVVSYEFGDVIAIGYGDQGTTFRVYETPEKQRLGEVGDALIQLEGDLLGAREEIRGLATEEGVERAIEQLERVGEQAREAIGEMDLTDEEYAQALEELDQTIEQGKEELRRLHQDPAARDAVIAEMDRRLEHVRRGLVHVRSADADYDFEAATGQRPLEGLEQHFDTDVALAKRAETELQLATSPPGAPGYEAEARERTEREIENYKTGAGGLLDRHLKEIVLAGVMTILDTPFIPVLPGFLTGYSIITGTDYVTGRRLSALERVQMLSIHIVMTYFVVKLVGVSGRGGALGGVRVRVGGRSGRGEINTRIGRGGSQASGPRGRGRHSTPAADQPDGQVGTGSARGTKPPLDEVMPPVDDVLPPKGPKPPLDEVMPPVQGVPAPRATPRTDAPETAAARSNRLLDDAFAEPQPTGPGGTRRVAPPGIEEGRKTPPVQNTRPPGSTATQRVPAPSPGGKRLPKPGDPGTGTPPAKVFKSPPMKTAGNFYRARNRLDLSAGISRQQEQFDCWVTAVVDSARAAGRTDITRAKVIATAESIIVYPQVIVDGKLVKLGPRPAYEATKGGMWHIGYEPTLKALGADATDIQINTPGQFAGLGAYAQLPGRSVIVDIDIVGGGGHATRLLKHEPTTTPRPSGVDPAVPSPNPGKVILADPGPGIAKEIEAIDLFQQAMTGWMIRWH